MKRLPLALSLLLLAGCTARPAVTVEREPLAPSAPTPIHRIHHHPAVPTRFRAPGITADVVRVPLVGSSLTPPDDPDRLGWWGRRAGARHGVTLLTGHTVHTGGGALDDLEDVPVGARVRVSGVRYIVASVRVLPKATVARRAPRLFSQSGPHRLVVVTCEDYDPATGHYASNVVLVAKP